MFLRGKKIVVEKKRREEKMEIEKVEVRLHGGHAGRIVKGFANVMFSNGWVVRDFKILKLNGQKTTVLIPTLTWRDEATRQIRYSEAIFFPEAEKREIEKQIIEKYLKLVDGADGDDRDG